jgi:hypothetical protein
MSRGPGPWRRRILAVLPTPGQTCQGRLNPTTRQREGAVGSRREGCARCQSIAV